MHKLFSPDEFNETISCPKCSWKGKGKETDREELFLTDATELYCPQCGNYLGIINREERN